MHGDKREVVSYEFETWWYSLEMHIYLLYFCVYSVKKYLAIASCLSTSPLHILYACMLIVINHNNGLRS